MEDMRYTELNCKFPVCNHSEGISSNNLGYVQGVLEDGTPFEAELWKNESSLNVSFILPDSSPDRKNLHKLTNENITYFHNEAQLMFYGILADGMVFDGECDDTEEVVAYVDHLVEYGLVTFVGNMGNGIVLYFTDVEGNELVYITVTLEEDELLATTPLQFGKFYNYGSKVTPADSNIRKWKVYSLQDKFPMDEERKRCIEQIKEYIAIYSRYGVSFPEGFPDRMSTEDMKEWIGVWSDFNPYPDID